MEKSVMSLDVLGIPKVYEVNTDRWSRNFFDVRHHDGIALVLAGKIEYHFADYSALAQEGDIVVLPGNLPYSGSCLSERNTAFIVIDFDCSEQTAFASLGLPCVIPTTHCLPIRQKFRDILHCYATWRLTTPFRVRAMLYNLLSDLIDFCFSQVSDTTEEILRYIAENLADPNLRQASLCERFFMSDSQLRRNLRKLTGMSFSAYVTSLRLERAASDLRWSDRSVKEIALSCGFADAYYFSNCFSKRYGCSPTTYRKKNSCLLQYEAHKTE